MSIIKKADLESYRASRRTKNLLAFRPTGSSVAFTRQHEPATPIALGPGIDHDATALEGRGGSSGMVAPTNMRKPRP